MDAPDESEATGPAGEALVLAPRLRERRQAAAHTGGRGPQRRAVAAHLSRLESGLRQPSLPVLLDSPGCTAPPSPTCSVRPRAEPDPIVRGDRIRAVPAGGWTYWRAGGTGRAMQALRVHVRRSPAGAGARAPGRGVAVRHGGELELSLGDRTHRLAAGDSAHFDSLVPHRLAAAGTGGVDLLFVHTLMQSETSALCIGTTEGTRERGERR